MLPHQWHTPRFCPTMCCLWAPCVGHAERLELRWHEQEQDEQDAENLKKAPQAAWLQMDMKGYSWIVIGCSATTAWTGYRLELQWAPSDGRLILIFNKFHKCSTSPWVSGTTRILHANHRSSGRFPDVNKGWNFKLSRYRKTSRKPSFHLHVSIFLVKSEPFFSCLWDSFWKKKIPKKYFFFRGTMDSRALSFKMKAEN